MKTIHLKHYYFNKYLKIEREKLKELKQNAEKNI